MSARSFNKHQRLCLPLLRLLVLLFDIGEVGGCCCILVPVPLGPPRDLPPPTFGVNDSANADFV